MSLRSQCLGRDFCKAWVWRVQPVQRNQKFLLSLKEQTSLKGHSIDNSNEYKFIYVPSSSSSEKKKPFSTIPGYLIFFLWKFEPGWQKLGSHAAMWQAVVIDTFFCILIILSCRTNFQFPVSASLWCAHVIRNPLVKVKISVAGLS